MDQATPRPINAKPTLETQRLNFDLNLLISGPWLKRLRTQTPKQHENPAPQVLENHTIVKAGLLGLVLFFSQLPLDEI